MTRIDRIGLDLGPALAAETLGAAAAEAGADLVRVRFALGDRPEPDGAFIEAARGTTEALRAAGLRILGIIDSDLTVAPEGMGAFAESTPGPLARVWIEELVANAAHLAASLGDRVSAWEILPEPNRGRPARIAPARWAELLAAVGAAMRAVQPQATLVAGGLVSDDDDDGVDYLRAAFRAAREGHLWPKGVPPFDALGIVLRILPDGGASEDAVASQLGDRTRRLWRVMEQVEGEATAAARSIFVTGLAWDADRSGPDVQARNVWTALDSLTSDPVVRMVVWSALNDARAPGGGAVGLYAGASTDPADRRWAWNAFNDFALYARQISPSGWSEDLLAPAPAQTEASPAQGAAFAEPEPPLTEAAAAAAALSAAEAMPAAELPSAAGIESGTESLPETLPESGAAWVAAAASLAAAWPSGGAEGLEDAQSQTEAEATSEGPAVELPLAGAALAGLPPEEAAVAQAPASEVALDALAAQYSAPDSVSDSVTDSVSEVAAAELPASEAVAPLETEPLGHLPMESAPMAAEPAEAASVAFESAEERFQPLDPYGGPELPDGDWDGGWDPEDAAMSLAVGRALEERPDLVAEAVGDALAEGETVSFVIPDAAEVLRGQGFEGPRLAAILEALRFKYGSHEWLPPGEYCVRLADAPAPSAAATPPVTNQQIISALYRAGGGTWDLLERTGLQLSELTAHRNLTYQGPDVAAMEGLSAEERGRVARELGGLARAG